MKWTIAILGALVITGLAAFGQFARHSSATFVNLHEAKASLVGAGFYCTPDKADGSFDTGFMLSRGPQAWRDAATLCKIGPMGAEWQGKAWVTRNTSLFQLQTMPEKAGLRVWGNVFAFGDEALLRELDGLLP